MSEKCTTCEYEAVRILRGRPYCLKCYEEELVLLAPDTRLDNGDNRFAPSALIHVGNPHPSTPHSELQYEGCTHA